MFLWTLLGTDEVLDLQDRLPDLAGLLIDGKLHVAANHHLGQFLFRGVLDVNGADIPALAQDRAAVRDRHDLVELVGDEQDALALGLEAAHNVHELVISWGSEPPWARRKSEFHCPVEHFQDLDTLLHADGDVADQRVRVTFRPYFRSGP